MEYSLLRTRVEAVIGSAHKEVAQHASNAPVAGPRSSLCTPGKRRISVLRYHGENSIANGVLENGLMGETSGVDETKVVEKLDEIQYAQGVVATLEGATEIEDERQDDEYWEIFREAEERLEPSYDAELDAEEDIGSSDEEMYGHSAAAGHE